MTRPTRALAALTTFVAGLALAVPGTAPAGAGTPTPSDPPAGAPVVTNDHVRVAADGMAELNVLANDSDPDDPTGADLTVCRTLQSDPSPVGFLATTGFDESDYDTGGHPVVDVFPFRAKPGTYTLTYGVCDYDYVTPATLTVRVTHRENVVATKLKRPGRVRFHNPGPHTVKVQYGSRDNQTRDGRFRLAPHASQTVTVTRHAILWTATYHVKHGTYGTGGFVTGIKLPRHHGHRVPASRPVVPTAADRADWQFGLRRDRLRAQQASQSTGTAGTPSTASTAAARRDEASDAPVTAPDTTSVSQQYFGIADVLRNDSDPDGTHDDLAVCRVSVPAGSGLYASVIPGFDQGFFIGYSVPVASRRDTSTTPASKYGLVVYSDQTTEIGSYDLTYYACDEQYLTPETLTVEVTKSEVIVAGKVADRPGVVRFHNPGAHSVRVRIYDSARQPTTRSGRPALSFQLPGHTTKRVRPHLRAIMWEADGRRSPGGFGYIHGIKPGRH